MLARWWVDEFGLEHDGFPLPATHPGGYIFVSIDHRRWVGWRYRFGHHFPRKIESGLAMRIIEG